MRILTIGGMHGNEPLGIEVVREFSERPIDDVKTVIGNPLALDADVRFVVNDMNRSFPGDEESEDYETRRAAELLQYAAGFDVVLDFHNTNCPDNDCVFIGENSDSRLLKIAGYLGLKRVIVADYDCINKYAGNCLSVEVSLGSSDMDAADWRDRIAALAEEDLDKLADPEEMELYRFAYRMTLEDRDRLDLSGVNLRAFEPIDPELASRMNVDSPAYPVFIGDTYTPYNYGGLINKI